MCAGAFEVQPAGYLCRCGYKMRLRSSYDTEAKETATSQRTQNPGRMVSAKSERKSSRKRSRSRGSSVDAGNVTRVTTDVRGHIKVNRNSIYTMNNGKWIKGDPVQYLSPR